MAFELIRTKSIPIAASFASKQFTFVKIDTSGKLANPGNGAYGIGVIQDNPANADDPGSVCYPGDITKITLGGTVTAGQEIMSDSTGKGVAATSGSYVLGVALAGGSSGARIPMIYQPKASKL